MMANRFTRLMGHKKTATAKSVSGMVAALLAFSGPTAGHAQTKLELDCLGLAGSPVQTDLPTGITGKPYDQFDAQAALPVCEAAMAEAGQKASTRLVYVMGRTYQKLERNVEAFSLYKTKDAENYAPILQNLGAMYDMGSGLPVNNELAFSYFQRAGQAGLAMGWTSALAVLDKPDAPASLKPNLPEVLRQVIFSTEDAAAPERLAAAIKAGEIEPLFPEERQQLLEIAMNRGNLNGVVELLQILTDGGDLDLAVQVADKALKIAQTATIDQDAGWPVHQPSIALNVIKLAKAHPTHAELGKRAAELDARYGDRLFPINLESGVCNDVATPLTIYAWDETPPNLRQIDDQVAFYKARGCVIGEDIVKGANAILAQSVQAGTSFVADIQAALEAGKETTPQQQQTAEAPADDATTAAAPRKASEVYAVFEKGPDGTYWVNPAPDQNAVTEEVVKVSAGLECSGKNLEGVFSVFRNPNQRTVPDFKARVVATLVQGSDCDLEQNVGVNLGTIDVILSTAEKYSHDVYATALYRRDVADRLNEGLFPSVMPLFDACQKTVAEQVSNYGDWAREFAPKNLQLIGGRREDVMEMNKVLSELEAELEDRNIFTESYAADVKYSLADRAWDAALRLLECASQTGPDELSAHSVSDPPYHSGLNLILISEMQKFMKSYLVYIQARLDLPSGGRTVAKHGDWDTLFRSPFFESYTSVPRSIGVAAFGYKCDSILKTQGIGYIEFVNAEKRGPKAVGVRSDDDAWVEVELSQGLRRFFGGETYFVAMVPTSSSGPGLVDLVSSARKSIQVRYEDGSELTFSAKGSTAAINSARSECEKLIAKP